MKILYYNWVDYRDPEGRGGGVTVYQKNLMDGMAQAGVEARFLCAGLSFDLRPGRPPRWEPMRHGPKADRARRYEIINAGTLAPGQHAWGNPAQVHHPETVETVSDFITKTGPYDVFHLNNLEGLPAEVLTLKERFPQTRFILSLHNYFPFCPQVNLWRAEAENCTDFKAGAACVGCLPKPPSQGLLRQANALSYRMRVMGMPPGTWIYDKLFRRALEGARWGVNLLRGRKAAPPAHSPETTAALTADTARQAARAFADRRAAMARLINAHCDAVLCVSERVRQIAETHDIRPELLHTSYIGSAQAPLYHTSPARAAFPRADGTLTLAFLGYMRRDKGAFFLLDALEALPDTMAARIKLVLAARGASPEDRARLARLESRLAGLSFHDGYTHDGMDALLAPVDVGLVPVLWEDNLPQVAIEMHARRIPLVTSDLGGAPELGRSAALRFAAGDIADFHACLARLLEGGFDAQAYWDGAMAPVTIAEHTDAVLELYRAETQALA